MSDTNTNKLVTNLAEELSSTLAAAGMFGKGFFFERLRRLESDHDRHRQQLQHEITKLQGSVRGLKTDYEQTMTKLRGYCRDLESRISELEKSTTNQPAANS